MGSGADNCVIHSDKADRNPSDLNTFLWSKSHSYFEYAGDYSQSKSTDMGICTIRDDDTTVLGDYAKCKQHTNDYLSCEAEGKTSSSSLCKFNYYIFGDDARYIGIKDARLEEFATDSAAKGGKLWLVSDTPAAGTGSPIVITAKMTVSTDDVTSKSVVTGSAGAYIIEDCKTDNEFCAWECSKMCIGYNPDTPCISFAWHQATGVC